MTDDANVTIEQLDAVGPISSADFFALWQGTDTYRLSMAILLAHIAQGVPNPPSLPDFCMVALSSNKWSGSGTYTISWDAASGSRSDLWDTSNKTRIVVPSGTTYIRVSWGIAFKASSSAGTLGGTPNINGSVPIGGPQTYIRLSSSGNSSNSLSSSSPPISVTQGDYLELNATASNGNHRRVDAKPQTFLCMELLN